MEKMRQPANLTLPRTVKTAANEWAKANGTDLSNLVERVLRDYLESKGVRCDISLEDFIRHSKSERESLQEAGESNLSASKNVKESGLKKLRDSFNHKGEI